VANAIFDGTDAVMLSAESAAGNYPVQSVRMMDAIVRESEKHLSEWGHLDSLIASELGDPTVSIASSAKELSITAQVKAIVVFTLSGSTALMDVENQAKRPYLRLYAGNVHVLLAWYCVGRHAALSASCRHDGDHGEACRNGIDRFHPLKRWR